MLLFASGRCDILAFYSKWLMERIKDKVFYSRNPYNPKCIYAYRLEDVDSMIFCTKNPIPIMDSLDILDKVNPYFFITITPYKKDIEKGINKNDVIESLKKLSLRYGKNSVSLRYDPIFIDKEYTKEYHYAMFDKLLSKVDGYIDTCIISFIDIYPNVGSKGFKEVNIEDQKDIVKQFVFIAKKYNIKIQLCNEDEELLKLGCSSNACISNEMLEKHLGCNNLILEQNSLRECKCVKTKDIGSYACCPHLCKYCYANGYDEKEVMDKYKRHNPKDLCIDGNPKEDDKIHIATKDSIFNKQIKFDL